MPDNHDSASMKMTDLPGLGAVATAGTPGAKLDAEVKAAAAHPRAQGEGQRRMADMAAGFPPPARLAGGEVLPGGGPEQIKGGGADRQGDPPGGRGK